MIVLDTNVLSETQRALPDPRAMAWLDAQDPRRLYITAVTVAELRFGIAAMPDGRRKTVLHEAVCAIVEEEFRGRVLAFDGRAADFYGTRLAGARKAGLAVGMADAQIAAIALAAGFSVAARDTRPFAAMGVSHFDPWLGI